MAPEGRAALDEFDDLSLGTDLGNAFTSPADSHPVDVSANGDAKLRRITQWVTLLSDCTVRITPLADEVAADDQAYTAALTLASGAIQRIEVPCSVRGRRFGARVEVLSGTGTALGSASLYLVPKRSLTGGDAP